MADQPREGDVDHANISQADTYLNAVRLGLHESMQRFDVSLQNRCEKHHYRAPARRQREDSGNF